ncbi:MAG: hypothetical protein N3F09_03410 [Bacteroidia bacterium]|nr:hypothetical protein [Bacteroidia bacterium]
MKIILEWFIRLLVVICGLVFIVSAYTKLDPVIETFEMAFVRLGIAGWKTAPWIARFVIGLEIITGILLVVNYELKKTALWAIVFLMAFNSYLFYQIVASTGEENCGCFGEVIYMSPAEALIKNSLMILILSAVFPLKMEGWKFKKRNAVFFSVLLTSTMLLPHILNPVFYDDKMLMDDESIGMMLPLDLLYENRDKDKVDSVSVDFRQGKHIVAFLSLTCPHCRIAAKKIKLMKELNPNLPFYLILNGDKPQLKEFMDDTRCTGIPYSFVLGKTFVRLAGTALPRIYIIQDGVLKMKRNHITLQQSELEDFIKN